MKKLKKEKEKELWDKVVRITLTPIITQTKSNIQLDGTPEENELIPTIIPHYNFKIINARRLTWYMKIGAIFTFDRWFDYDPLHDNCLLTFEYLGKKYKIDVDINDNSGWPFGRDYKIRSKIYHTLYEKKKEDAIIASLNHESPDN